MTIIDFSEKGRGRLLRGLLFLAACFVGLALAVSGFKSPLWTVAVALLAGLGANCLAVALGLVMLNRFSEERRRAQWNMVRASTMATIQLSLWIIGGTAVRVFGVSDPEVREPLVAAPIDAAKVSAALKELSARLPHLKADGLVGQPTGHPAVSLDHDKIVKFATAIRPRCRRIHGVLLLAVQAGADAPLANALQRFWSAIEEIEAIEHERMSFGASSDVADPYLAARIGILLAWGGELFAVAEKELHESLQGVKS
jgi:MFS family permease